MNTIVRNQTPRLIENKGLSAKELFVNRIKELPASVQKGLLVDQNIKVSDHELYAFVKANGAANIEMFNKTLNEGLATNIHQGTVPNDMFFLVTSIVLCTAVSPTGSSAIGDAVKEEYNTLNPILKNAKFTFKCGQDTYFNKCGAGLFQTDKADLEPGEYRLENPKFLFSKQDLSFEMLEIGAALAAETWVKIRFKGIATTKK